MARRVVSTKFHLPFEIMTNDKYESAARTGNWFHENPLAVIADSTS
jgi:hypothetical protein